MEADYSAIIRCIARFQPVWLMHPPSMDPELLRQRLGLDGGRLQLMAIEYNDTWCRDYGPIGVFDGTRALLLDCEFNGWGNKFDARLDNAVNQQLAQLPLLADYPMNSPRMLLEGGAIDGDGKGTLLTVSSTQQARFADRPLADLQQEFEAQLAELLGIQRTLWLDHGWLEGDDTDAHVDTLARFISPNTIAYQACDDANDSHHAALQAMAAQLQDYQRADGQPYDLVPLPWPAAMFDANQQRLPASYANFLFVNGALLVPAYGDAADEQARALLAAARPDLQVVSVPARSLIEQHGSLHCITMNIPAIEASNRPA